MSNLPPQQTYNEVITGISPLERDLVGVHPRLHLTAAGFDALRVRAGEEPYVAILASVREQADGYAAGKCPSADTPGDHRGIGDTIATLAFMFLMTREDKYLKAARDYMVTSAAYPAAMWHAGLLGGHLLYGNAIGFDWLYHDLDAQARDAVRTALRTHGEHWFLEHGTHTGWAVGAYTCNHSAVHVAGLAAAAVAIYGEPPDATPEVNRNGPWLKLVLERLRLMTIALGHDGMSPEGLSYGEYYTEYLIRAIDIVASTLGEDFFAQCPWLRNYGFSQIYSSLPTKRWDAGSCVVGFGDGVRGHWYGPGDMLRRLARAYRDSYFQGFADAGLKDKVARPLYLDAVWHDPTVAPQTPAGLPTFRHFDDKGVVVMRSGWDGDESIFAIKCGAPHGRWALRRYAHDIGGGHMHPDAGAIQLLIRGDRLIADDGYTFKRTATQNTAVVNGVGQTGEGGEWFESIELRREKRSPQILRAQSTQRYDYVIADATDAYEPAAGLTRFLRHVIYIKPDCWIIVDEFQARDPSRFELSFHGDSPFVAGGAGQFTATGPHGALRVSLLRPAGVEARTERRPLAYVDGKITSHLEAMTFHNAAPATEAVFVTVLEGFPAGQTAPAEPSLAEVGDGGLNLSIPRQSATTRLKLQPGRPDRAAPIF